MEKKLCLLFSLTLSCCWVESAPNRLDQLKFDQLTSDESYSTKEDIEALLNSLDDTDTKFEENYEDSFKPKSSYSGFRNKRVNNKKVDSNHNIEELKKLLKIGKLHDEGNYDNEAAYILGEDVSGKAAGVIGKEDREYKKGTKTRGFHRVQHKDEYKKDKEFYEDDETSGVIKKIGAKGHVTGVNAGSGRSKYRFHNDRDKELIGKQYYLDKGNLDKQYRQSLDSRGLDSYFNTEQ